MRIKLLAFTAMCLLLSAYVSAQVKWDGGGDNVSWDDQLNWVGDVVPAVTDDVLLDNTIVTTAYDVTLPAGAVSTIINSLTITPSAGINIRLFLPATNTAITGLVITSAGDGLILDNRAFLINSSSSNISIDGSIVLQAGSLVNVSSGTSDNIFEVKGDLTIDGSLTETGTSSFSSVLLSGTAVQNITVAATGSITGNQLDFEINNAAGAVLLSDLVLPYQYTISSGNITLGNFSLTTPFVSQIAPIVTNHIITNGSGFLIIPNVGAALTIFPVGINATSVNPVEISNGSNLTYSIRVEPGVNPPISLPLYAIDRTWIINTNISGANPTPANVTFYYYTGQGRTNFNYASTVDIGQYLPSAWNILQNGLLPTSFPPEYRAFTSINSFNSPFIVGNHGAILPIDFAIVCKAQKNNDGALISWNVGNEESVSHFEIEKSVTGGDFKTYASVLPGNNKLNYQYNDNSPGSGSTLYRVKVVLNSNKIRYSNTVAVIFNSKALLITSVAPNPVQTSTKIRVGSAGNKTIKFELYDIHGRAVKQWQQNLADGTNVFTLQMENMLSGTYFLSGTEGNTRTNIIRIIKQ